MKIITILLNIASVCLMTYLFIQKGMPRNDELLIVIVIMAANLMSLITILSFKDNSLLGLFIQRKKLEEQQKIEIMSSKNKS